ncbi:MAG: hypothetical protein RDV48_11400 [Candidatus Eremiobacteraeota bacterium]|nr:hypothetical protein [Candidatus Eremiobacteraeota bacterium]
MGRGRSILIYSFEPFLQWKVNSATMLLRSMKKQGLIPPAVTHMVLPVVFEKAAEKVLRAARSSTPDIILGIGQAAGYTKLSLERIALNVNHATRPDNRRQKPHDELIREGGPLAYWTTIPYKKMEELSRSRKFPFRLSFHAGTYVCNNVLFMVLDALEREKIPALAGFLHVPLIRTKKKGKLSLEKLSEAMGAVLGLLASDESLS